ncbi:MAG: hypothetical protein RLQ25_02975 [Alphaproteobacteria bacterium]
MSEYHWYTLGDGRRVFRKAPKPSPHRSDLSRPYVRSDGMDAVWNPVDGNHYESRSQYERAVKQAGCEIVGDDKGHWGRAGVRDTGPDGLKEDIVQAWQQLSS